MTAELSDVFRTKREGMGFVLDAVEAVARAPVRVFTTAGEFLDGAAARARPLDVPCWSGGSWPRPSWWTSAPPRPTSSRSRAGG